MKVLRNIIIGILAFLGVGFVILMLIPDEWLEDDVLEETNYNSVYEAEDESYWEESKLASTYEYNESNLSKIEGLREKKDYSSAGNTTIFVYMNGSDLESDSGEATADISEMINAKYSDNVNIIIQTMGTKKWSKRYGISSKHSQRYKVLEDGIELLDDSLPQLDCTDGRTLMDFINWGVESYPADRYELIMWDHGGGPVYGFGYDEFQDENAALTVAEMRYAIAETGVFFDFIGMDCCIMSSIETCCALYDACDYMILSEDFESGLGWSYTGWIDAISDNPAIPTTELARIIIDDFVYSNEQEENGDSGILALIDQSVMTVLYSAWTDFAYANEDELLESNYSKQVHRKSTGRILPKMDKRGFLDLFFGDEEDANMSDYYVTDIMAVAENVNSKEKDALESAIYNAIVYCNRTKDENTLTGLSVTLPYGDEDFYTELKDVFIKCGIDENYVNWLGLFTESSGAQSYYSYSDWEDDWEGWDSYEDDFDWEDWDSEYYLDDCMDGWCDYDDYYYDEDEFDEEFDSWWDSFFGY